MAGKPITGDGLTENLAGMTKSQLYGIMSQMKALIEQNKQQAKEILIQNPPLTKALFQIPSVQPAASQQSQQSSQASKQSNIQAAHSLALQEQAVMSQNQPPMRKQHQNQPSISISSTSAPPSNLQSQPMPSHPLQAPQQPKGHLNPQVPPISVPQSSQLPNIPPLPLHSASQQPPLHQPQVPTVSTPLQQPLQTTGIPHMPLQPPLPPQSRLPSAPNFHHQYGPLMRPNVGFQHPGAPQHPSQPMYHPVNKPQASMGPSFPQGQPPLPSQIPPMYQAGGSHLGAEFNNQGGSSMQVDRGSSWMSSQPESSAAAPLPGPPQLNPGHMGLGNQPNRATPLTPEMEKALLQQVMSLTPEQISLLPPEQRNQVLQLQQMLRQ
ncbi:probable serine/threonine-protein kinase samkC isoform X2 [Ricinus communis]|uniref:probable serine/threonine-protein kinase samkC isoform X2 n=1 Tax=Ricinus communis TaxID=3988 RepID=UPI00201A3F22|nr:probable serine/threonine-protein kinase samkC isoform X2 [Ricinus communis]